LEFSPVVIQKINSLIVGEPQKMRFH